MKRSTLREFLRPAATIAVGVLCVVMMQTYAQRSIQGRLKDATQYLTAKTGAESMKLAQKGQYEPYYLTTDYNVLRDDGTAKRPSQPQIAMKGPSKVVSKGMDLAQGPTELRLDTLSNRTRAAAYPGKLGNELKTFLNQSSELQGMSGYVAGGRLQYGQVMVMPDESWRYNPDFHTEEYDRIYENEYLTTAQNPLSTFSIDVDTASYANVRRFLNNNQLPPPDAVRVEEMVNYFDYQYPQPEGGVPFSITIDGAACPWNPAHQLARIGLQGKVFESAQKPPSNLVFLIDVSGSMNEPSKLSLLKSALKMLVSQLTKDETVGVVVYAGAAGKVLDSTPGDRKSDILAAIDNLQAGGSTAGGAGVKLAYQIAKENFIPGGNNRVILATDGDFNVGVSSDGELVRLIEDERKAGVFLTVLGFGTGNYKDSKMEQLADKGNGNYYYIDTINEAKKVLVQELGSTLFTIAKDVKIQVEFNPNKVKAYRLIGYENRVLAKEDFNDDTKDAGELGAGHTVTALYELVPADSSETFRTVDDLKYQQTQPVTSDEVMTVKLRYKEPDGETSKLLSQSLHSGQITGTLQGDFQFAAAVAEFGMLLRDSKFKGTASYDHAAQAATAAQGQDPYGYRAEFIGLVHKAKMADTRVLDGALGEPGIKFKGQN